MLRGIGASGGIGIGKIMLVQESELQYETITIQDTAAEMQRYHQAVEVFSERTMAMAEEMKSKVGVKDAEILEGHVMMIQDPTMTSEVENLIQQGHCAEAALDQVCQMFINVFSAVEDELTNQRVTDIQDIRSRMLGLLLNREATDISQAPLGTVLLAKDLTPSMTASIVKENIVGIITETGGKTSHSAILSRALEIPAVLSVEHATVLLKDEELVVVDGEEGYIIQSPSEQELDTFREKIQQFQKKKQELTAYQGKATVTKDNRQVELFCNIGTPDEAAHVLEADGEGVGLFRTEFLFMDQTSLPTEEEQFEAYKKAVLALEGRPLIIRTLDIGGDKEIPYLGLEKEENPFLGFRAVRFCLDKEDIYKCQLRAILRASAFGDIRIMVPLVTGVEELRAVKELLVSIQKELDEQKVPYHKEILIGIMAETPAATLIADLLAEEADFISIGTNDLTQYTLAVDRGNAKVAYLYSTYHPAVLRSVRNIIHCAKVAGKPVGMCGEAASDPLLIPLLLAFGLDEFSVSTNSVLMVRKTIADWSLPEALRLAEKIMTLKTESEVSELLKQNKHV